MKKFLFTLAILSWAFASQAQYRKDNLEVYFNSNLRPPPELRDARVGNPFLYEEFYAGVLKCVGQKQPFKVKSMRFNSLYYHFEIMYKGVKKYLPAKKVETFYFIIRGKKQLFINNKYYKHSHKRVRGFVQIVSRGNIQLLKQEQVRFNEADYNVTLNVGRNYDEILRKTVYFFAEKNLLYEARNKRGIYSYFAKKGFDAKAFVKQHKIDLKTELGKKQLVAAYNVHAAKQKFNKK